MIKDDDTDLRMARAALGEDARPTGRLRRVVNPRLVSGAYLQQEWRGEFGVIWLDVPNVSDFDPEQLTQRALEAHRNR